MSNELFKRPRAETSLSRSWLENKRRVAPLWRGQGERSPQGGPSNFIAGALPIITIEPAKKPDPYADLPEAVQSVARMLPVTAAKLLGLVVQQYEEGGGRPVSVTRDQVADHFKITSDQADAALTIRLQRELLVKRAGAIGPTG
jgi:hypothetical protein